MNDNDPFPLDFYTAGGTLPPDAPSYVERPTDDELFYLALARKFCNVLTPRQMGKSSVMVRTAHRLRENGVRTAIIDLTQIGTEASADQWYLGLLARLKSQLQLRTDPHEWWQQNAELSPTQRFTNFLHDIVLTEISDPVTIFIDEIDSTLRLDFSDDFFAAIRAIYNARATEHNYYRLTFILLGVATPTDLIQDPSRTPFNIGQRIDLRDFSRQDASVLQIGIEQLHPGQGQAILDRIFHWTSGHPYLTQKLCLAVAESERIQWTDSNVDELVQTLFLSEEARKETNLQFVRDSINASSEKRKLLLLYKRIYQNDDVEYDERSAVQNRLKLFGLVIVKEGKLQVRNLIYRQIFTLDWIKESIPVDWTRRIAVGSLIALLMLTVGFVFVLEQQRTRSAELALQQAIQDFDNNTNPALRLNSLDKILSNETYAPEARSRFLLLSPQEREELFLQTDVQTQQWNVISGTYYLLTDSVESEAVMELMIVSLARSTDDSQHILRLELSKWLEGRSTDSFTTAVAALNDAIEINPNNPGLYLDRAAALAAVGQPRAALDDLQTILQLPTPLDLNEFWATQINQIVVNNATLHNYWYENRLSYADLEPLNIPFPPTPTPEGFIRADAYEPNNEQISAKNIASGQKLCMLSLWPEEDVDYFSVRLKSGSYYEILTSDISPGLDTFLEVYDETGQKIGENDDYEPLNDASLVMVSIDNTGIYYVHLTNNDPSDPANKSYCLEIHEILPPTLTPSPTGVPMDFCEPNNTIFDDGTNNPCLILLDTAPYSLNFAPLHKEELDEDYFKLAVKEGLRYTCETFNLSGTTDTVMTFFDENEEVIAGPNDDKEPGDFGSKLEYDADYTGNLYVLVKNVQFIDYRESPLYTYDLSCQLVLSTSTPTPIFLPTPSPSGPTPTAVVIPTPFPTPTSFAVPTASAVTTTTP